MSSFKKRMSKNNVKFVVLFSLVAILIVGMIFALVKIDKNEKTKTLGSGTFTYAIGLLDDEGGYEQGTSSIYLKDFYSVDGLTIEVKEDATVTYSIFFYNEDKENVGKELDLEGNFDITSDSVSVLETAKYFKIMITPTNDAEVSWNEINTYASQLTVTINK